jgi:hypothetical protein
LASQPTCARSARPLPRGFTFYVAHPIRSIPVFLSTQRHPAFRDSPLQKLQQTIFGDVMANEQTSVTRVADRGELPLLLDTARQFAGQYIDSLEERPVFPSEKIPASNACFARTTPRQACSRGRSGTHARLSTAKALDATDSPDELVLEIKLADFAGQPKTKL